MSNKNKTEKDTFKKELYDYLEAFENEAECNNSGHIFTALRKSNIDSKSKLLQVINDGGENWYKSIYLLGEKRARMLERYLEAVQDPIWDGDERRYSTLRNAEYWLTMRYLKWPGEIHAKKDANGCTYFVIEKKETKPTAKVISVKENEALENLKETIRDDYIWAKKTEIYLDNTELDNIDTTKAFLKGVTFATKHYLDILDKMKEEE